MSNRLVRIRYSTAQNSLVQAWITKHGSVVISIGSDIPVADRGAAVRQALRTLANPPGDDLYRPEKPTEMTKGSVGVIIPTDPIEAVSGDPTGA